MSYIDNLLEMADAQTLTATGNTVDTIDFGSDVDMGRGQPLYLVITLDAVPNATDGDETYVFTLVTDDNASFSSPTTLITQNIPRGTPAGTRYVHTLPYANERHIRGTMTLGGTTPSITFSAWITSEEPSSWQAYPDAI